MRMKAYRAMVSQFGGPAAGTVIVAVRLTELSCRPSPGRAQSYRCGRGGE
jgi:hypothetical protein